jgi:hypothetical protein
MRTGIGFRAAIERNLQPTAQIWQKWLFTMLESRVFLQQTDHLVPVWWRSQLVELQTIHLNPHSALDRLENLRRKMKVIADFRRKSGHALLQARVQLFVMTLLYLALFAATMSQFGFERHRRIILISFLLFIAGQTAFWLLARKRKWNT